MKNSVFGKTMENVPKPRYIKLATTNRRSYLVSEPNYHTSKWFSENLLAIEIEQSGSENEQAGVFRSIDFGYQQDSVV